MRLFVRSVLFVLFPAAVFAATPVKLATAPPPAQAVVREIKYDGQLRDNEARFGVDLDLEVTGQGEAALPLIEGEVAVLTTKLPANLRLVRDGNVYRLVADKEGRYRFKLELVAKITRQEPWNKVSFVGPEAAIGSVAAQAGGAGVELQLLSGTVQESVTKDGVTKVRGFLGPERAVAVRWSRGRGAEVARKALLTCETAVAVQVTPTVVKYKTDLRFEILQGAASGLTLALPAAQALTKLQGDGIRDWQLKADGDHQALRVEFVKPVEKSYSLTLLSEQTVENSAGTVAIAPPQPQEVERESGALAVSAEDVLVETDTASGLRQVNATGGALAAYQFYARPFALAVRLRRIEPVVSVADRVLARVEETRLLVTHALALNVEKAGVYVLELTPQPGLVVADVRGDGIEDWKSAGGKLTVNFSSRLLGNRRLEVQLERALAAAGSVTNAPDGGRAVVVEALRVAGAVKETAEIGAAAAPGIQLKTVTEGLVGVREVPITRLLGRGDETLAYTADQADWKLTLAAERLAARITADVFNLITIGDGLLGGSATIRFAILNQGVQEFRVRVPAIWKNVEFTGPNIRRKELEEDVWVIGLQEKAWGGYTLVVTYDYQFDPHKATLPIGGIHPQAVVREAGSVAITSAANLQLAAQPNGDAIRRVDEAELSANDRALISRPVLMAYKYQGPSYGLAVDVTRFDELPVLDAAADRTQLTTVLTEDGQMVTQASFMVKNNDRQFQTFTLPAGAVFWTSYIGGEPVVPEKNGGKLLIPLPRRANRDEAFAVDIVYKQKIAPLKSAMPRALALTAPVTDMQTTYAEWELYVPPTERLARFGGNMIVARGTTYGLQDAWRNCVQFYQDLCAEPRLWLATVLLVLLLGVGIVAIQKRRWIFGIVSVIAALLLGFWGVATALRPLTIVSTMGFANPAELPPMARHLGERIFAARAGKTPEPVIARFNPPPMQNQNTLVVNGGVMSDTKLQIGSGERTSGSSNAFYNDGHAQPIMTETISGVRSSSGFGGGGGLSPTPTPERAAQAALVEKLNQVVIPEITLRDAVITDVVRFLSEESRSRDPNHQGVNIVLQLGETAGEPNAPAMPPDLANVRHITVSLRNIPLMEALKYVTAAAGLKFSVEPHAVVILPKEAPEGSMITRSYRVESGALRSVVAPPSSLAGATTIGGNGVTFLGSPSAASSVDDVRKFFTDAGVPFPAGSRLVYDDRTSTIIAQNTPENLEAFENTLSVLNVVPRGESRSGREGGFRYGNLETAGKPESPLVAGIRPIRIEIPRTGQRLVFTKVLNVGKEPLAVRAMAMEMAVFKAVRGTVQALVFAVGVALAWWQWRRTRPSATLLAAGLALAFGAVVSLLVSLRLLGEAMIVAAPVVGLAVVVWGVRRAWRKSEERTLRQAQGGGAKSDNAGGGDSDGGSGSPGGSPSQAGGPAVPPAVAALAVMWLAAGGVEAATVSNSVSILSANYTGVVRAVDGPGAGRVVQFEAVWELEAGAPNQTVRLLGPDVAVQEFSGPAKSGGWFWFSRGTAGAELVREGPNVSVRLPKEGAATVRLKFLVKLSGDVAKQQIAFGIPPALSSKVVVTLDEPDAVVEAPGAVSVRVAGEKGAGVGHEGDPARSGVGAGGAVGRPAPSTGAGVTRIEAVFGAADRVELTWTPRMKRAVEIATTVFCQNASRVMFGGGVIGVRSVLDYQVTQGELRQMRVAIPAGQRLMRVEGDGIRTWKIEAAAGEGAAAGAGSGGTGTIKSKSTITITNRSDAAETIKSKSTITNGSDGASEVLVVELMKGVTPAYRLVVETEKVVAIGEVAGSRLETGEIPRQARNDNKVFSVEIPHAVEVKRETGMVALQSSEELGLTVETQDGLQKVDVEEFGKAESRSGAEIPSRVRDRNVVEIPSPVRHGESPAPVAAYRFLKPEFALAVRVEPVRPQIEAVVWNATRISAEQIGLRATVQYTIKRAGVFTLQLTEPAGYRLERVIGANVSQWVEKDMKSDPFDKLRAGERGAKSDTDRILEVTLKERTQGAYRLEVELVRPLRELPKSVEVAGVQPLGTQKLAGFVSVTAEEGVQIKSEPFTGLTEVPAATVADVGAMQSGALAFKLIPGETSGERPGWKLSVATEKIESWLRAEVMNTITLTETLVSGRSVVRYEIQNAPTKQFRVRAPAAFKNVEVTGANIRRKDHDEATGEWRIELQNKVRGNYPLTVTWEQPWNVKTGTLELLGVEAVGVERETGALAIQAPPRLKLEATGLSSDLQVVKDARDLPEWAGRAGDAAVLTYKYLRPGYKLALTVQRFEEAEVLQALADNVRLTTVVSEDGQMMTEMASAVRNNARQYLEVTLPAGAQVWSAFVAGQPVRPSKRDGKLLLPMERSGGEATVAVEVTYVSAGRFPRRSGTVELESPALDVPLKNARWELYLPPDYSYGGFEGTMQREAAAAATTATATAAQTFTYSDYVRVEGENKQARDADVSSSLSNARSQLKNENLGDAYQNLNRAKGKLSVDESRTNNDLQQLEKELRQTQTRSFVAGNAQVIINNGGQIVVGSGSGAINQGAVPNAPAGNLRYWQVGGDGKPAQPVASAEWEEKAAEQQVAKVQQAQEVAVAKALPLRVTLPRRGVRYAFSQVWQTETGKPMSVRFAAAQARSLDWPAAAGAALAGVAVLWALAAAAVRARGRKA